MAAFTGKWKRVSASNVDDFIKAVGAEGEKAANMRAFLLEADVVEDYTVTDNESHRKIYINGKLHREVTSVFDQPQEVVTVLGKSTLIPKKVSDTRLEFKETAPGRSDAFSVLTAEGNKLILDYTYKGVTCRRIFEKE